MEHELQRLRKDLEPLEDPETICSFGQMACDGDGVEQDYVEAIRLYHEASEHGDAAAQCTLGRCYALGNHVPVDSVEAYKWIRLAADQDYEEATDVLAMIEALFSPDEI